MTVLRLCTLGIAAGALLGVGAFMIQAAALARKLPDLPFHMRLNPFNILASRDRWTPEIAAAERRAATCALVFIIGILVFVGLSLIAM